MPHLRNVAFGLACAGFLLAGSAAQAARLDAQSISSVFQGQFEAQVSGYKVRFVAHSDGRLQGQAFGGQDKGKWYLTGDRLCVAWRQWTSGRPKCGYISQEGKWLVANNATGQFIKFRPAAFASLSTVRVKYDQETGK